jgi:hypothetical protein
MDLDSLLALEQAVDGRIVHALGQLAQGEIEAGLHTLTQARKLHPAPMIDHLIGFARDLAKAPDRSETAEITAIPVGTATNAIHEVNGEDMVTDGDLEHPLESVGTRRGVTRPDLVKWVAWLLMALAALLAFLSRWL